MEENDLKFSSKFYIFVSLLLVIIVFTNFILCFQFISSSIENKHNVETMTTAFFQTKAENEIKKIRRIEKEVSSQFDLAGFIRDNSNKSKTDLNNIIYSEIVTNVQPIYSFIYDTSGNIFYTSAFLSEKYTQTLNSLYKIYLKDKEKFNVCFFYDINKTSDDLCICVFEEINKMNYSTASYDTYGYHCILSSININEFFYGYDHAKNISLRFFNGDYNVNISNGDVNDANLELSDTHIPGTNWHFDGCINYRFTNNSLFLFMLFVLIETLLLLTVILIFFYDTKKNMLVPLKEITTYLDSLVLSQRFNPISISATCEIESIATSLNTMIIKNKSLTKKILLNQQKLYDQEHANMVSTMYALQSQVNPHFIYNTLEIIRSLALTNRISDIESITINLAKILRYNLNTVHFVTLKEELEIIKCYIAIMDIKYKNEYEIEYDVPECVYDRKIIRMLFQPIIENSFGHGFSVEHDKFKIKISAYIEDNQLILEFYDNGLGCTKQKLKKIRYMIYKNKLSHKHIGLSNLYHRLYLYYHDHFSMDFNSVENKYTLVTIKIKL